MPLYPGDTTTIRATIKNKAGEKIDALSHEIKIFDPNGALKQTSTDPVHDGTGEYHLDYTIPNDAEDGTWKAVWKAQTVEGVKTETIKFDVLQV